MKNIMFLLIVTVALCGCSGFKTNDTNKLNAMIDWKKEIISIEKAHIFKLQADNFKFQRQKDKEVLNSLGVHNSLTEDLFKKWDLLIKITEDVHKYKLIGTIQLYKIKILIVEIETIKSKINKEIEVMDNGKNNGL